MFDLLLQFSKLIKTGICYEMDINRDLQRSYMNFNFLSNLTIIRREFFVSFVKFCVVDNKAIQKIRDKMEEKACSLKEKVCF